MFTIKATYAGQTRKASFPDKATFPTYEDIVTQIHRLFSISNDYYLSKLLFSPEANAPSRILITKEVRTISDFNKCIRPFRERNWPNALLRFTICDATHPTTQANATPRTGPSSIWSVPTVAAPEPAPMDVDTIAGPVPGIGVGAAPLISHRHSTSSLRSCCSVAQGKADIEAMIKDFQSDLNRVLENTLPRSTPPSTAGQSTPKVGEVTPAPPSWCSLCTRDITSPNESQRAWYSCADCHVVVCKSCHHTGRHSFCLSVMGPHNMKLMSGAGANPEAPRFPTQTSTPFIPAPLVRTAVPATSGSPASEPVKHNATCDACNKVIYGIRHKCLDCPDYDLCSTCIKAGHSEIHNPFHEFFEITQPGRVIVHSVLSGNGEREVRTRAAPQLLRPEPTPEPIRHLATCDLCDSRIVGDRYKCLDCPDFDTCSACYGIIDEQHPLHPFVKISTKDVYLRRNISASRPMHYATCDGCHKTIYGARFKCMHADCPDYDLCQNCEALPIPVHPANHPMLKMKTADTVIPTVYRVGQRSLISQSEPVVIPVVQQVETPRAPSPPVVVPAPFEYTSRIPSPRAPTPVEDERAKTPTPVPQVAEVQAEPPTVPEMQYSTTWTSELSKFFDSYYTNQQTNLDMNAQKPTSSNPFIDMAIPTVSPTVSSIPEMTQIPNNFPQWPSAPQRIPYPWPTNRPAERAELLRLIADVAGPYTSPQVLDAISEPQPIAVDAPAPKEEPARVAEPVAVEEKEVERTTWVGVSDEVAHLIQSNESPKVAESIISLSREPLLARPEADEASLNAFSVRNSLASLIKELPSLVPPSEPPVGSSPIAVAEVTEPRLPLSAAFVEDVTVADGQVFPPGAEFVKCWRLLNDSAREWPASTELVFLAGESLSATAAKAGKAKVGEESDIVVAVGKAMPGQTIDVWTGELKAPEVAGRYVGYWRLRADGELFGNSLWIEINVAEVEHNSDESMASSMVIMPNGPASAHHVSSVTVTTLSTVSQTEDNMSDAGSDISLISMPSSSSDSDDVMWHETRSHPTTTADSVAAPSQANGGGSQRATSEAASTAMDYVLLYDENSSGEE